MVALNNIEVETSALLNSLHGTPYAGPKLMGCQELWGISNTLKLLIKGHVLCKQVVLFGRVGPQVVSFVERFLYYDLIWESPPSGVHCITSSHSDHL